MKKIMTLLLALATWSAMAQTASVLSTGDWWRIEVEECGIYRLTTADVPVLEGAAVAGIGLYGGSGDMMPMYNRQASTADLQPVAIRIADHNGNGIFDAQDEILFYGEGPDVWRYVSGDQRWEYKSHAYAPINCYYLTTTAIQPLRIATASAPATADTVISTYTAVAHIDNDLVSIIESGQLWMGEKFSNANPTRSFQLQLPGTPGGATKIRYALASVSTATAGFTISTASGFSTSHYITSSKVYSSHMDAVQQSSPAFTFNITYMPEENTAEGYLDYIELNGRVPLAYQGGQLVVRNDQHSGGTATFSMSGAAGAEVWNVSRLNHAYAVAVDGSGRWTDSIGETSTYIVFDNSSTKSPSRVATVANQNLHGAEAAEYVVICHPMFLEQAQRLASLHAVVDGYSTLVVTDEQVYNEYSGGKQDPMALRALLRSLRERHPDRQPRFATLFGKANYDNRDRLGKNLPTVVIYETPNSFDSDGGSYCSDDMIGYLDANEHGTSSQSLDVAVGRMPALTVAEAEHMVDKVEHYLLRSDLENPDVRGDWRNYVALLSDDADPGKPGDTSFVHSSEQTATDIKHLYPTLNIDRLYADAYHQQSGSIGSFYPDLNNALDKRMNYGCLLINYIGHGSSAYIGTERFIELSNIERYSNTDRLPLFITSTCSIGRIDHPDTRCGSEAFLTAPAAAIAVVGAARPIPHIHKFNNDLILSALDGNNTIGEALQGAKNRTGVSMCIGLTGDPGLHLSVPQNTVAVTHVGEHAVESGVDDTATVLSQVTIRGEIHDPEGALISDFNGTIYPIVFDREVKTSTLANDNEGTQVAFAQQKNILYKGNEEVRNGKFEYSFIVPRDVAYQYAYGKLSHYAKSGSSDASGEYSKIMFGGLNEDVVIDEELRPEIRLFIGDTNFRTGGMTDCNPTIVALLKDSVGINAVGSGIGHDITAVLDDNASGVLVLNDFYEADIQDSRCGTVRYALNGLEPGPHTLTLKAWNIYNMSNSASIGFTVYDSAEIAYSSLACYPNPASDHATFHFETNNGERIATAVLNIYNMCGQLVASFKPTCQPGGYVVGPVRWEVAAAAPGIYLATMMVTTDSGKTHRSSTKCVVR